MKYGPIIVGVHADNLAFRDVSSTGLLTGCAHVGSSGIDHVILLVGFDSNYWIVKNSWGTGWGDRGYAKIRRGAYDCGITSYIVEMQVTGSFYNQSSSDPVQTVSLRINQTDLYGDGWQETINLEQNGNIVATFGTKFPTGSSYT